MWYRDNYYSRITKSKMQHKTAQYEHTSYTSIAQIMHYLCGMYKLG